MKQMKYYILDCENITDRDELHARLARLMGFPDYYGNNLDALYDMLGERSEEALILKHSDALKAKLGEYGQMTLDTLSDAAENGFGIIFE